MLTVAIVVFGVGQLVIPPLADHITRDRLSRYGTVLSVRVSAFPAIKLLFGDAGDVRVRMASYTAPQRQLASNLNQAGGVAHLIGAIAELDSGQVKVDDVTFAKHGRQVTGTGEITDANLRAAVPLLRSLTPIAAADGGVTLRGTVHVPVLGDVSADASLGARNGKVALSGTGEVGRILHLTVWSNPGVYVESVSGRLTRVGIQLFTRARLR